MRNYSHFRSRLGRKVADPPFLRDFRGVGHVRADSRIQELESPQSETIPISAHGWAEKWPTPRFCESVGGLGTCGRIREFKKWSRRDHK